MGAVGPASDAGNRSWEGEVGSGTCEAVQGLPAAAVSGDRRGPSPGQPRSVGAVPQRVHSTGRGAPHLHCCPGACSSLQAHPWMAGSAERRQLSVLRAPAWHERCPPPVGAHLCPNQAIPACARDPSPLSHAPEGLHASAKPRSTSPRSGAALPSPPSTCPSDRAAGKLLVSPVTASSAPPQLPPPAAGRRAAVRQPPCSIPPAGGAAGHV